MLDGGLLVIKNTATKMLLISNYAVGNSYATVVGNIVASVAVSGVDFTTSGVDGASRVLTTAIKTATATAAAPIGNDLHIAFTDGTSSVLWVTDEITNQAIILGNTINFPAITHTVTQPV